MLLKSSRDDQNTVPSGTFRTGHAASAKTWILYPGSEKVFPIMLHHMFDGLHYKLMPLFQSILVLFFKVYFSESVILTFLLCTEFLTQESELFRLCFVM